MKSKLVPAYLDEDSFTGRITPKTLGKMVAAIEPSRIRIAMDALDSECLFRTREHRKLMVDELSRLIDKIKKRDR